MGKRIKSYLVFTSLFYKLIMFLLMPVAVAGLFLWLKIAMGGIGVTGDVWMASLMLSFLSMLEVVSDNWLFGGIQTRNSMKMDYLRTSGRGMGILRNALSVDMGRRFLSAIWILALYALGILWIGGYLGGRALLGEISLPWGGTGSGGILWRFGVWLFPVTVSWLLSVLGTFLARFADILWTNVLVGYGVCVLGVLSWHLPGLWEYIWVYDICFLVLGLLGSFWAVTAAMKKVEGSYYD